VYEGFWEQGRREGHGVLTRRVAAKARHRPGQPHEDDEDDEDDEDGDEALRVGEGAGGAEGGALAAAGEGEGEGPLSSEGGVEVYEGQWQNDMQVGEPKGWGETTCRWANRRVRVRRHAGGPTEGLG
jgi:hypothetical protein